MAVLALVDGDEHTKQHKVINEFDNETRELAIYKFNIHKEKGVILSEFSDDMWVLYDEKKTVRIDFNKLDEVFLKKYLKNTSVKEFKNYIKYFICILLETRTLESIKTTFIHIVLAAKETKCFTEMPKNIKVLQGSRVADFIDLFPEANKDLMFEEEKAQDKMMKRDLAEYQSYFLLANLMERFWKEANQDEKDLYYPLYLWWNVGSIMPTRITEFAVVPRKCLYQKNGKYIFKLRRSKMKGVKWTTIRYNLKDDFNIFEYEITDALAGLIMDYQERKKEYGESKADNLFSDKMFCGAFKKIYPNIGNLYEKDYFSYDRLNHLLKLFYKNYVEDKYCYNILSKEDINEIDKNGELRKLLNNEIVQIAPGDMRHIAIQNMLLNGCNILTVKEMIGHRNINTTYHYASNMKNLIKCRAYNLFQASKGKEVIINNDFIKNKTVTTVRLSDPFICVDGGKCYSYKFATANDASDCFAVCGDCEVCRYFVADNSELAQRKRQESSIEDKLLRLDVLLTKKAFEDDSEELRNLVGQIQAETINLENCYIKDFEKEERKQNAEEQ